MYGFVFLFIFIFLLTFRCTGQTQEVREKYQNNKEGMEILSLDEDGLTRSVPQGSAVQESNVVVQLRKLMEDVGGR